MFKVLHPLAACCLSCFTLTAVSLRPCVAHAEVASAPARIVFFTSQADPAFVRDDALQASRAALGELGVELSLEPRPASVQLPATLELARRVAAAERALAVVWLDVDRADIALYFFDSERGRLLSRRVVVSASQAAAAEEVAIILRSAANALLEGGAPEMTEVRVAEPVREPPPAPPAPPPALPSVEPPPRVLLGASYFGTWFAEHQGLESGVRIALTVRPLASPFHVGVAYTWFSELTVATPEVEARVTRHPGELWFALELGKDRLRLAPELALMADLVHRRTERAESPLVASPSSSRWLFGASARARGLVKFAPGLWFTSSVGLGFVANAFDQVVATASGDALLLEVFSVRPELELGVRVELF